MRGRLLWAPVRRLLLLTRRIHARGGLGCADGVLLLVLWLRHGGFEEGFVVAAGFDELFV